MIDSIESVGNCKDRRHENALIFFVVDLKCDIETELTTAIYKMLKIKFSKFTQQIGIKRKT